MHEFVFTVAIPSYNRAEVIQEILKLLLAEMNTLSEKGELLIIDDASTDDTLTVLKEYEKNNSEYLSYLINEKNLGISKTRNRLVKQAKGKYLIFIDSDVIPSKNLIKEHLTLLTQKENTISQGSLILISALAEINNKKFNPLTDFSNADFDTANVGVEKSKIEEVGFFDENFWGYGWEDLELGLRLKKIGLKTIKNKKALAYHLQPYFDLKKLTILKEKEKQRAFGTLYFVKKQPFFKVKLMTQYYKFNIILNKIFYKIFKLNEENIVARLTELQAKNNYNKYVSILRFYLNNCYVDYLHKKFNQKDDKI